VSRTSRSVIAVATVAVVLFATALWFGPRSCDGGLEAYFVCGVGALVIMFALPFVLRSANSLVVRVALAVGFVALGAGVWVGGLAAADFRIMCRMF
jgi:hypothetical protein